MECDLEKEEDERWSYLNIWKWNFLWLYINMFIKLMDKFVTFSWLECHGEEFVIVPYPAYLDLFILKRFLLITAQKKM